MSLTQRKATNADSSPLSDTQRAGMEREGKGVKDRSRRFRKGITFYVLLGIFCLLSTSFWFLPRLLWFKLLTLSPAALSFWLVVEPNKERDLSQRIVPLALVVSTISTQVPVFWAATFASAAVFAFGLATVPAYESSQSASNVTNVKPESAIPVVLAVILMIGVLLIDNFFVWVVAATFKPGQSPKTSPDALQDNGKLVLQWILSDLSRQQVVGLRRLWNVQWSLVACLGASFVCLDVFRRQDRTLYRVSRRAVLTLSGARLFRIISFSLTVLPSQSKYCYMQRFPVPPPEDWFEWMLVGFRPYAHGGCNDLVVSGHATVMGVLACISASVAGDVYVQFCLWGLVFFDYCAEVYEGFHYSVDMFLGTVLVCLFWRVLAPTEEIGPLPPPPPRRSIGHLPKSTIALYFAPVLGAFAQLTILPRIFAVPTVLVYVVVAIVCLVASIRSQALPYQQAAYQHMAQHALLCLLVLALGVWL